MRFIRATMLPDGRVTVEGKGGYVSEHRAACLAVELNESFLAEDISYHCFCFDLLGTGHKQVSNNIYGGLSESPAYRSGNKLYCPLPESVTAGGEVRAQIEAHKVFEGQVLRVQKSAVFKLRFEESITGYESSLATDCGLLSRLQAALALMQGGKSGICHLRPEAYEALEKKDPLRFYLVDEEAEETEIPEEPEEPEIPEEPEEPELPEEPEEPAPVAVSGVSLNKKSLSLEAGQTAQLTATVLPPNADNQAVSFTSSKATVASVSSSGLVTAKAAGSAVITVSTEDGGFEDSCSVSVTAAVQPGLWQGTKTANGITVTIQGKRVTINGVKNSNDSNQGGGYFTDNMPVLFGNPTTWQTFPAGTKLSLKISNVTGSNTCKGINAACVLRQTDNTILMGGTWAQPEGEFEYTCSKATAVYGLLFYMQNGESCENFGFDVEFATE